VVVDVFCQRSNGEKEKNDPQRANLAAHFARPVRKALATILIKVNAEAISVENL
jgi:hypothetical protein